MTREERAGLEETLLREKLKYYRAANRAREREEREREFESFLARKWGYEFPRSRRR
jgi:hypothetical protein